MAARAVADQYQPINSRIDRFLGVPQRGHIVKHQPAIGMHLFHHLIRRVQTSDDQRHLELGPETINMGEPITGRVNEAVRRVSMGNSLVVIVR